MRPAEEGAPDCCLQTPPPPQPLVPLQLPLVAPAVSAETTLVAHGGSGSPAWGQEPLLLPPTQAPPPVSPTQPRALSMSTIAAFVDGSSVTWRLLTPPLLRPLLPPLPPRLPPPLRRRPPPAVLEATNLATSGTGGFPDERASGAAAATAGAATTAVVCNGAGATSSAAAVTAAAAGTAATAAGAAGAAADVGRGNACRARPGEEPFVATAADASTAAAAAAADAAFPALSRGGHRAKHATARWACWCACRPCAAFQRPKRSLRCTVTPPLMGELRPCMTGPTNGTRAFMLLVPATAFTV